MSEGEQQEKKKRIDLSVSQLAGGGVATLTAATAASYLGVYGTIAGAAIMSVMSTAGTAVVQHYLRQSGEKAKDIADRAKRVNSAHTAVAVDTAVPPRPAEDVLRTRAMPTVGSTAVDGALPARSAGRVPEADEPATELLAPVSADGSADPGATQALPSVGAADGPDAGDPLDAVTRNGPDDDRTWWQRYRLLVIPAAAVFGLAMIVILLFELFTGRNLADTVQGNDGGSSPSLLGGGHSQQLPDAPATTPPAPSGGPGTDGGTAPETDPTPGTEEDDGADPGGGGQETEQPQRPTVPPEPPETGGEEEPDPGTGTDPGAGAGQRQDGQSGTGARQAPAE